MFRVLTSLPAMGALLFAAFSSSPTYQLQNYGLGGGGTSNSTSPTYKLNGTTGEVGGTGTSPANTAGGSGTTQVRQANQPLAPTLSSGSGTYYNKLQIIINTSGSDASDYKYSVAVSTDNYASTTYLQADGTLGVTPIYQSYTAWGGASGSFIIGLSAGVTYKAKVNAMQGGYTNSAYGPAASATTANPSLSFSITPGSVSLGTLTPGNVVSGSSNLTFGFATNGSAGGAVYIAGAYNGLRSTAANYTIPAVNNNLTTLTQGFGVQGLTAAQTSGGPLAIMSPFNGTANTVGAESTTYQQLYAATAPVVGGSGTAALKGKASVITPSASDYSETLTFIAAASF